ncbi:lysine acetyltransferase [Fusarium longipes]|uniref:Lysine acetyltransferase n=1 Tax=Fusarium longipes TaxID=694270 RepID=A0A395T877_9HYPO|nr:lysine acetyltransferase [Fusarium longipes]
MASLETLPPVTSPSLILTNPTTSERERVWKGTHPQWGGALKLEDYIAREYDNINTPLARNGGLTSWILTDGNLKPDERPILSSCETYKKRALVSNDKNSTGVRDGTAHGVASVFTFPEYRKRGYGRKMMSLLADELRNRQQRNEGDADFSVLWSDVGPNFYGALGWKAFRSSYLELPVKDSVLPANPAVQPLNMDDIPKLAAQDEQIVRNKVASSTAAASAALIPDIETVQWHMNREDFMCNRIFSRIPTIRGALYTPPEAPSSRIWATWTRSFYGGLDKPEKNIVRILRLTIEDECISDETLAKGIEAIAGFVQKEASEWLCSKVELWNPEERIKRVTEGIESLDARFVVRENDHLSSLNWFGNDPNEDVEWIVNERFAWC